MALLPPEGVATYSHSLKLDFTAKGLRISCHVYAMDGKEVIEQVFETYEAGVERAKKDGIPVASMDSISN